MSVQGTLIFQNLLGKETAGKGKSVFEKLSEAVYTTQTGMKITGDEAEKVDGFSIQAEFMEYLDPTAGLSEEQKKAYEEQIMRKLRSGKKLTPEELNYLRVKNPQMYVQAARVQAMRENLKNQLENCHSKEEVEKVYGDAMSMVSKEDPMREALIAAYDDVTTEFKKTDKYQALPAKEEDARQKTDAELKMDTEQNGQGMEEVK